MGALQLTLAITESVWEDLIAALDLEAESAAVLTARVGAYDRGDLLLAREVRWVPDEDYVRRGRLRLTIASAGYVPALSAAEADGSLAIFVHTHPGGDPSPSAADDTVDAELRSVFGLRTHTERYVSLIIGGTRQAPRFSGRAYGPNGPTPDLVARIRIVGQGIRLLLADENRAVEYVPPSFDRQVRAFGHDGQMLLSQLRVAVIGAGGTGSAVHEQLARLGIGDILIVDDDLVDDHNVSRIHESRVSDRGQPKVAVLADRAREIGLGSVTTPIQSRLLTPAGVRSLVDRDVVFGCTDDDFGRAVLSRLAYWYLIPVIDMGVVVDTEGGVVREIFGRVTVVGPGAPCLLCRGRVDGRRLAWASLSDAERAVRVHEGYVPQLQDPAPSVVPYTSMVASMAVAEMLTRLFGLHDENPPSELLIRLVDRSISRNGLEAFPDHFCGKPTMWGRGDEPAMLGWTWPASSGD